MTFNSRFGLGEDCFALLAIYLLITRHRESETRQSFLPGHVIVSPPIDWLVKQSDHINSESIFTPHNEFPRPWYIYLYRQKSLLWQFMKYRLKQDKTAITVFGDDFTHVEKEIEKDVRKMSFYRSNNPPVLALGSWPGIALWKVKVQFTSGDEKDFSYKTEPVKD
jgi:hypothetical protein